MTEEPQWTWWQRNYTTLYIWFWILLVVLAEVTTIGGLIWLSWKMMSWLLR